MIHQIIVNYGAFISLLALIGIQISPIKINPFTWLGKKCGKLLGIDDLKSQVTAIDKKVDENERDRIRYEILQFAGSLRNGLKRTPNDYQHIEELYMKYHDQMHFNSYITSEMEYIRKIKNRTMNKRKYRNNIDKQ